MSAYRERTSINHLEVAHEALSRGAWETARAWFEDSLDQQETAEAWEGLAIAAWWQNDAETALPARLRAYRLFCETHDRRGAARVAAFHAIDYCSLRNEPAIASGWLRRAHRLLEGQSTSPEHAMVLLWEGHIALSVEQDTGRARDLSRRAFELSRSIGELDWQMFALALEGLAMVYDGEVDEGMRYLDEAATAAVAGDLRDLDAIGTICCYLIMACERVRDYVRAAQWCDIVKKVSARWSYRLLFSLCWTHYAGVLIGRGAWDEAEVILTEAISNLNGSHQAMAADGLARLAELRRRQGRLDEAEALYKRVDGQPLSWLAREYVLLGRASLALEQSDAQRAIDLADRFMRALGPDDHVERASGLAMLARARAALGGTEADECDSADSLDNLNPEVASPLVIGTARYAQGMFAVTAGELEKARRRFEDAVDSFAVSGAPYEQGLARLELSCVLSALGRHRAAREEAQHAWQQMLDLGARDSAERARILLTRIPDGDSHGSVGPSRTSKLTTRELELLRLVADGLTDNEISERLDLSVHTVHRHLGNVRTKLAVPSRSAAVSMAARMGLI